MVLCDICCRMACDKILGWIDDQILRDINIEKIKFPTDVNANAIFYIRITFLEKNCISLRICLSEKISIVEIIVIRNCFRLATYANSMLMPTGKYARDTGISGVRNNNASRMVLFWGTLRWSEIWLRLRMSVTEFRTLRMRLFIVIPAGHNRCCNVKYSNRYRRALFRSPLSDFNHKLIGYRSNSYPSLTLIWRWCYLKIIVWFAKMIANQLRFQQFCLQIKKKKISIARSQYISSKRSF